MAKRSKSVLRVEVALREAGLDTKIVELEASTRTAELAAQAIGTPLGTIVKSLVFLAEGRPILALVAGDRRASGVKIAREVGVSQARLANADEVRAVTGFAIGGVPPLGHNSPMTVLVDKSLARFQIVHAAAGSPHAVFPIHLDELMRVTQGHLCDIVED